MKKLFFALMLGLAALACTPEYDDTALKDRMDQIEQDADEINAALAALMERIAAAEKAIEAVNAAAAAEDYVVSVLPSEDGKGVIVTFRSADPVFIPLDLDAEEIDEVVIASVEVAENKETATFTYTDGTTVVLPLYQEKEFALVLDATHVVVNAGETVKIPYTVTGANETTVVDVLATSAGYLASVTATDVVVSIPEPFVAGEVLVWADNAAGKASIRKITFEENAIQVDPVTEVPAAGGDFEIKGVSNVDVVAEVVEGNDWLSVAPAAKADFAPFTLKFVATENTGWYGRTATVEIKTTAGTLLYTQKVAQASAHVARIYARYSTEDGKPWCSFLPGLDKTSLAEGNRSMASDGKYIYLNNSIATPTIYAVEIASLLKGDETPVYKALSTANISGGTHGVSTLEVLPNEGGDPVLIATNLAVDDSENFNIYAYSSGIDADPVLFHAFRWDGIANTSDWRRYGDRISVSGTWQKGSIWAASHSGTKVMGFHIENGATDAAHREYCWFDTFSGGLAEATMYPGETKEAILTTATSAGFWTPDPDGGKHAGGNWPKWNAGNAVADLNGAFSFQFFTLGEKKYIAYVQLSDNTHCDLKIVEDLGTFETSLAGEPVFTAPLYQGDKASCAASNTYGDCSVVEIDGKLHIVAMMQGGGLSIFHLN